MVFWGRSRKNMGLVRLNLDFKNFSGFLIWQEEAF